MPRTPAIVAPRNPRAGSAASSLSLPVPAAYTTGRRSSMRILHVTPFYEPFWAYGGMARASAALCRALVARGHDVTAATALLGEGVPLRGRRRRCRVRRFPGPRIARAPALPAGPRLPRFLRARARRPSTSCTCRVTATASPWPPCALFGPRGRPWLLAPAGTFPHHGQYRLAKASSTGSSGTGS